MKLSWGSVGSVFVVVLVVLALAGNLGYRWMNTYELQIRVQNKRKRVSPGQTSSTPHWEIKTDKGTFQIRDAIGVFGPGGSEKLAARLQNGRAVKVRIMPPGLFYWQLPMVVDVVGP